MADVEYEDDPEYEGGERYCWSCDGRGWKITCIDDLWECNRNGEKDDWL